MKFRQAAAPHLAPPNSVSLVMRQVLVALIPATLIYVWFFGPGLLVNMAIAVTVAVGAEAAVLYLRGRPVRKYVGDLSAVLAAVLLAFALPPLTPWWITATGAMFAIVFAKQLFGGIGYNPFNPAMAGYVVLLISFPAQMTAWLPPAASGLPAPDLSLLQTVSTIFTGTLPPEYAWDSITMATPLDQVRTGLSMMKTVGEIRQSPLFGDLGGTGWEWLANAFALGGIWMLYKGVIRWHIPVSMLGSIIFISTLFFLIDPGSHPGPAFHLFSGATMIGAFFIATDPVSAATTEKGRLIYGAGIGILTYVIRSWGGYPDGVAFAVLIMNMTVPIIDKFTVPRVYGHER